MSIEDTWLIKRALTTGAAMRIDQRSQKKVQLILVVLGGIDSFRVSEVKQADLHCLLRHSTL